MQLIRAIDKQFNLVAEIPQYQKLVVPHQMYGAQPLELTLNKHIPFADKLAQGHLLIVNNNLNNVFEIRHKEIALNHGGSASENWLIRAVPLHYWLGQRICMPPTGHGRHLIENMSAIETAAEIVRFNVIEPEDALRTIPNLQIGEIRGRGFYIDTDLRFGNALDKLQELAQHHGFGFRIRPDIETKMFYFDVYVGEDRSGAQDFVPPVIFSPDHGTLAELEYIESSLDYKSTAIVGGSGEGLERKFATVNGHLSGLDRYEVFVDATDVENTRQETKKETDEEGFVTESILEIPRPDSEIEADLIAKGNEKLAQHTQQLYASGQVFNSRFIFGEHWHVGDVVTLKHDEWGIALHTPVTTVVETHSAGQPMQLDVTFAHEQPTFFDKVKRHFKRDNYQ